MARMETIADVIDRVVRPALGADADQYDLEAIAHATYEFVIDTDEDGAGIASTWRFEPIEGVDFWETVAKHELSA